MNSKHILYLFLLILVVLSKEILVFNEEILVLFAFSIFVFLVYNFASESISLELDSRSNKIEEEFNLYKDMQKNTFSHLISYHKKQLLLLEEIKLIYSIVKKDIDVMILNYSNLFLKYLSNSIDDKLRKIFSAELKFTLLFQERLSAKLYSFLILKYNKGVDKKSFIPILRSSMSSLSKIK